MDPEVGQLRQNAEERRANAFATVILYGLIAFSPGVEELSLPEALSSVSWTWSHTNGTATASS